MSLQKKFTFRESAAKSKERYGGTLPTSAI